MSLSLYELNEKLKQLNEDTMKIKNQETSSVGDLLIKDTDGNLTFDKTVKQDIQTMKNQMPTDVQKNTWNTVTNKVDKVSGKQLSTNDYTTTEKSKLANIEAEANKYVHPAGSNPHGTTKSDVGLNNVDNIQQATKAEFNTHKNGNITEHKVSRGVSSFVGNGAEVTVPHGLGIKPVSAYAFPTVNPNGYLGEVWIRMDTINLYIGNSGSFTGTMSWTAIG